MSDVYGEQITIPGLSVVANLAAYQYHFVKMSSTTNVIKNLGATTDLCIGVLQDAPDASGEAATVASLGVTLMVAGTSLITAGAALTPDSTGRAKTGGVRAYGRAIEPSAAIGDLIKVVLGVG